MVFRVRSSLSNLARGCQPTLPLTSTSPSMVDTFALAWLAYVPPHQAAIVDNKFRPASPQTNILPTQEDYVAGSSSSSLSTGLSSLALMVVALVALASATCAAPNRLAARTFVPPPSCQQTAPSCEALLIVPKWACLSWRVPVRWRPRVPSRPEPILLTTP
jgi:hypothetical protein